MKVIYLVSRKGWIQFCNHDDYCNNAILKIAKFIGGADSFSWSGDA